MEVVLYNRFVFLIAVKCGPHEVFDTCPLCPNTCESIGRESDCLVPVDLICEGRCVCQPGYYSNKIGECVTEEECLRCPGPHEYFSCQGACDNVCATINIKNQTNCDIIREVECNPMCYCEEGYARDENNMCIPIADCEEPYCCDDEVYIENPSSLCYPLSCSELGFPLPCPPVEDPFCNDKPACICKSGYVKNDDGCCIPIAECPSCGGDPNAVSGCGSKCGKTCKDFGTDKVCIEICYPNGCDCKEGYVYDEAIERCVKFENCNESPEEENNNCPATKTEIEVKLNLGTIALCGEFIYQLTQSMPNENFVTSPSSVLGALGPLTLYARGLVLEQLLKLQNLNCKDELKSVYPDLIASYNNQQDIVFEFATKYYANVQYPLTTNFKSDSQEYFDAAGENVNFAQNEQAAQTINDWVANRTRDRIQNLVSPEMLNADTVLVLVNAIYFLGNWVHQFNPNNTQKREFTTLEGQVKELDTMYQENNFNYYEDNTLNIQALEMFYKNENYSFLVILPSQGKFEDTVQALRDPNVFTGVINSLSNAKVKVYLPKMLINTDMDMGEMLKKANATEMFDRNSDGFEGILQSGIPMYVSAAVQKAFLQVDETGTEAAAATAIISVGITSVGEIPPVFLFDANRPYLYYILFNDTPIFCGAFVGDDE